MRPHLMFESTDFDVDTPEPDTTVDLVDDLDLEVLWHEGAHDDDAVYRSVRAAMTHPLADPAEIAYRLDVLEDVEAHPETMRELYRLATRLCVEGRRALPTIWSRLGSESVLHRGTEAMTLLLNGLRRARALLCDHSDQFTSAALTRLCKDLQREADDELFEQVEDLLQALTFRDGVLASARLGRLNQGVDHTLVRPLDRNRHRVVPHQAPVSRPHHGRTIARDDVEGLQDLDRLRDHLLHLAARDLATSVDDLLGFLHNLRSELAFFLGATAIHRALNARGLPCCRPSPLASDADGLTAVGLYDPCLALRIGGAVQGNDLYAEGRRLIFMTGANGGGKSTFLRAIGIAQLMMQSGMATPGRHFAARPSRGVFTHFRREEQAAVTGGALDEELGRMQVLVAHMRPGALLLCNESFASTNEREGAQIAGEVLRALCRVGVTVVFVSHLYELTQGFYEEHRDDTVFLRAQRGAHGVRTHVLRPGKPLPTSFGLDL